jgi:uncharacterized membrane protein (UPF0127 family)
MHLHVQKQPKAPARSTRASDVALVHEDGRVVCERCVVADGVWSRMRGLLGCSELAAGEGLLIRPTWSIHTAFMHFPIDVVFLASDGTIERIVERLAPWRVAICRKAKDVVELPAGEAGAQRLRVGDRISWEDDGGRS